MKSKSFRYLWLGQSIANLGDVLYIVGLISILYAMTGSALSLAMVPFLNTFGRFLSGVFAPILLSTYRLKSLLVVSQLAKTVVLLVFSILIYFQETMAISLILFLILVIAFLDGWAAPATNAMLPRLVSDQEIVKANSFISVVTEAVNLGAWAVGGILVAAISGQAVILLTFALFVVSTVMMFYIRDDSPLPAEEKETVGLLKGAWVTIWRNPLFRSIHVVIVIEAIANVVWIAAILYVFVSEVLHATEAWWGYLNTAFFIGLLIGGIICSRFSLQIERDLRKVLIITSIAVSVVTFLFGLNSIAILALGIGTFHGFIEQVKGITLHTYLPKEASTEELPTIYAAQSALVSLLFGLSSLLFGVLVEFGSVQIAFCVAGILLAIGAAFVLMNKDVFPGGYEVERE